MHLNARDGVIAAKVFAKEMDLNVNKLRRGPIIP